MTVVVGYRTGKVGLSGLHLGVSAARTLQTSLTVATIVPQPWLTPSLARVDGEFERWTGDLAESSAEEARRYLFPLTDGIEVTFIQRAHRSVSAGLIELAQEVDAEILVLGSLPSGGRAQVMLGTTADWLLHASPVPVAISPRAFRSRAGRLTRLSCAYSTTPESLEVVRRCVEYAERLAVPLRVITFAIRGRTMYPSEVGAEAEDSILYAWASQAREILEHLKSDNVVGDDVALQVSTGHSWKEAVQSTEWCDGELLALGTSPRGDVRRVVLGARSGKIIRQCPVPVLVLPG